MYACVNACVHACMQVCMYVCMYICKCVYVRIRTFIKEFDQAQSSIGSLAQPALNLNLQSEGWPFQSPIGSLAIPIFLNLPETRRRDTKSAQM